MSYAGPASRSKRTPDITPSASGIARPGTSVNRSSTGGSSTDRRSAAVFAAGIALGVVVGAGVALLFAPNSGYDTRRAIARRSRRASRRSLDAWDEMRDELRQAVRNKRRSWRLKRQRAKDERESV
jgi:gas vesicle protein